jgi:exonuclease III
MQYKNLLYLFCFVFTISCSQEKPVELKVLQLNIWINATIVPGAQEGVVDIINQTEPDVVLLCELKAGSETPLTHWLVEELDKRGKIYYADDKNAGVGILSKYPFENTSLLIPTEEHHRPILKASLTVNKQTVVVYSAHLDHQHYASYLPRGYSSVTWTKIDAPITDVDSILAANRKGLREEAAEGFLADAKQEIAKGHIVIVGGDFNEPSHLDWQADTKDIREHRGVIINWDVSVMLQQAGFIDAYRQIYPNPVTNPGFTWPAGNESAQLEKLYFAPDADERDRIDFIYYYPQPTVKLIDTHIVGPAASINHGQICPDDSEDIIKPEKIWSSDHKGNLSIFGITNY